VLKKAGNEKVLPRRASDVIFLPQLQIRNGSYGCKSLMADDDYILYEINKHSKTYTTVSLIYTVCVSNKPYCKNGITIKKHFLS